MMPPLQGTAVILISRALGHSEHPHGVTSTSKRSYVPGRRLSYPLRSRGCMLCPASSVTAEVLVQTDPTQSRPLSSGISESYVSPHQGPYLYHFMCVSQYGRAGTITSPVLHMWHLRHRQVSPLAQGHGASKKCAWAVCLHTVGPSAPGWA